MKTFTLNRVSNNQPVIVNDFAKAVDGVSGNKTDFPILRLKNERSRPF